MSPRGFLLALGGWNQEQVLNPGLHKAAVLGAAPSEAHASAISWAGPAAGALGGQAELPAAIGAVQGSGRQSAWWWPHLQEAPFPCSEDNLVLIFLAVWFSCSRLHWRLKLYSFLPPFCLVAAAGGAVLVHRVQFVLFGCLSFAFCLFFSL